MRKVLIADDESNILMLVELLFKELQMEVITAVDGEDALEKAKKYKPDMIITDVVMPKKNGFEVCREVRNTPDIADTPIIILSALGDEFNKITGFEEGADDYITKPFNIEELKARAKVLLYRSLNNNKNNDSISKALAPISSAISEVNLTKISTGIPALDESLYSGFPIGSNILIVGPVGSGKSNFVRNFVAQGLQKKEKCLYVAFDDDPNRIRAELNSYLNDSIQSFENTGFIRFVDAYSWSALSVPNEEKFAVTGLLELNQLSGIISDASFDLGQTVQKKEGGRRVLDSLSSLLVNFELPDIQRFISQIARTSISFGDVTSIFVLEEGSIPEIKLNNIKYLMDGVLEFRSQNGIKSVRVCSMKWTTYKSDWSTY